MRRLDPTGDLDLRPSSYDADRLRASLRCLNARGLRPYIVVAVHERTEKVAGLTELVVPAQHPTRADQYDTIIVPEHNGYGLARAIKARMLLELRAAEPQLRRRADLARPGPRTAAAGQQGARLPARPGVARVRSGHRRLPPASV